jgi:hypothetical protein
MKARRAPITARHIFVGLLLLLAGGVQAQFTFTTNNNALTITHYTGTNGSVVIPDSTNGYPITSIGGLSFYFATMTNVTIGNNVTDIGSYAFHSCGNLTNVTFGSNVAIIGNNAFDNCFNLTSITIPSNVTSISNSTFTDCKSLTKVNIPDGVTSIGLEAFYYCSALSSVTIGSGVTNIGLSTFYGCNNLTNVYFKGNAPGLGSTVFSGGNTVIYYLPGTLGWSSPFGGRPAVLWNPQAQTGDGSFGVRTNQFGFNITGSSNLVIVVEACTSLASPVWSPVATNKLNTFIGTNGTSYFSDPRWTNFPGRYYRVRSSD